MKNPRFSTARGRRTTGFTLVELLVVIVIIAVLVSLLLPAINAVRESGRRLQCSNHLRQLGVGITAHVAAWKYLPPATSYHSPRHNVINYILPYLDQTVVYEKLDLSHDWDDEYTDEQGNRAGNKPNTEVTLPILLCPSAPAGRKFVSDYAACTRLVKEKERGVGALVAAGLVTDRGGDGNVRWEGALQHRLRIVDGQLIEYRISTAHVRDGLSGTMLLFEDGGRPDFYVDGQLVEPGAATGGEWASHTAYFVINNHCHGTQLMNCSNRDEVYSFHPSGANFLFADGAVHYLSDSIDPEVFVSYFTREAEDDTPPFD